MEAEEEVAGRGHPPPETIFGATNVWVNPYGKYVEAEVDGETWMVSQSAVTRLSEQLHDAKITDEFIGSELLGLTVKAPITGKSLPVLPATFVDTELVTGVVYSVPAHAPVRLHGPGRRAGGKGEGASRRW